MNNFPIVTFYESEQGGEKNKMQTYFRPAPVYGDMRTDTVKAGVYTTTFHGKLYIMTEITGVVKKVENLKLTPIGMRAKILAEFKNGKRLSFFAYIDNNIKVNTLIQAVGVVKKKGRFFDFHCIGGCRRILSNDEINQLISGKKFEEVELTNIPWEVISTVEETLPIDCYLSK